MRYLLMLLLLSILGVGCNKSGNGAFSGLDEKGEDGSVVTVPDPIVISSFTPTIDPLVLTNATSAVFGRDDGRLHGYPKPGTAQ